MLCILKGNVFLICMHFTNPSYILCRFCIKFKTIQFLNFLQGRIQPRYNLEWILLQNDFKFSGIRLFWCWNRGRFPEFHSVYFRFASQLASTQWSESSFSLPELSLRYSVLMPELFKPHWVGAQYSVDDESCCNVVFHMATSRDVLQHYRHYLGSLLC